MFLPLFLIQKQLAIYDRSRVSKFQAHTSPKFSLTSRSTISVRFAHCSPTAIASLPKSILKEVKTLFFTSFFNTKATRYLR